MTPGLKDEILKAACRPRCSFLEGIVYVQFSSRFGQLRWLALSLTLCAATGIGAAAMNFQRRFRQASRDDYPTWNNAPGFERDVFTFARVQYDSGGYRGGGGWRNDFPDCDWNFSARLQELTTFRVDPNGVVVRLTDPELFKHPLIYMSNPNSLVLTEREVLGLRRYLLNGGFLLVDDFWTRGAWQQVRSQIKRVFPDRDPVELPRDHEIFHIVYELKGRLQVPSIFAWQQGDTFEYWHGDPEGDEDPHFWGLQSDDGHLMALFCHNNDIGDGWEREGENSDYFKQYSERVSYPLGINIVTYVMTH